MRLLFVCLGNICRSPAAECIMRQLLSSEGLAERFEVDSAGTAGYHEGDWPDPRTGKALAEFGYRGLTRSRQVRSEDFEHFDYIFAMDQKNIRDLQRHCPERFLDKLKLVCTFSHPSERREVPDPYYGQQKDFEDVVRLLEAACQAIYSDLLQKIVPTK